MPKSRWRKVCVVSGCGAWQVRNSRCDRHVAEYEAARGSREDRGYTYDHRQIRTKLLGELRQAEIRGITLICWRCCEPMHSWQELDADHSGLLASEGGKADCLTHAPCNRGKRVPA